MPARGGTTVVSPGTNFATSMAWAPYRAKTFSARRTHESGSSASRQSLVSTGRPPAAPPLSPGKPNEKPPRRDRSQHEQYAGSPGRRECANPEESRHRRERDAKLLSDYQNREDHEAVSLEYLKAVGGVHTAYSILRRSKSLSASIERHLMTDEG